MVIIATSQEGHLSRFLWFFYFTARPAGSGTRGAKNAKAENSFALLLTPEE